MRIGRGLRLIAAIAALSLIPAPAAVASGTTVPVEITDPAYIGKVGLDQGVCYEWMLYGVRGSGEPALQGAGIGATLKVVHRQLSRMMKFRDKLGSAFPVDYLALPVETITSRDLAVEWWDEQVVNNVFTNTGLRALALTCPDSKILLAGYSQGAIAISSSFRALARNKSDPISSKVRGAFLVGNPARNSNRALLRQASSLCEIGLIRKEVNFQLDLELCKAQDSPNYDTLKVRTPGSQSGFRVREFHNANDFVADFNFIRSSIGRKATVENRYATALAAHKNYTDKNRSFVNAIRRFSSEVR